MSLRTMSWAEAVTESARKGVRPRPSSASYVPPHLRGGGYNAYGRGFSEPAQYGSHPSYGGYRGGGRSGPGRGGRGGFGFGGRSRGRAQPPRPVDDVCERLEEVKVSGGDDVSNAGINFDAYEDIPVEATGEDVPAAAGSFGEIDLGECLNNNIRRCRYVKPTPVQRHAIPIAMAGRDLMACAQTGSGKTAAFCFPIISGVLTEKSMAGSESCGDGWTVFPLALILSPTRELASQIYEEAEKFAYQSGAKVAVVYGGAPMGQQLRDLERGVDILVATPGRLVDMIERSRVSLKMIKYLALDEADRMLDMGFEPQIRKIVQRMDMPPPGARQTLLFSATFPAEIQRLAADFLENYIFLAVGRVGSSTDLIAQKVEFVNDMDKTKHLCGLLKNQRDNGSNGKLALTLVFVETKKGANQLENWLSRKGFPAIAIHGDKVQMERERALRLFKCGTTPILVATDVASRGLDIPHVAHVVNFDFPKSIDDYVHRIGRTGRAGKTGLATAFFSEKNQPHAKALVDLLKESKQEVPDWLKNYAEQSSPYGGDQGQKYGGSNFGGYDFRRSENHYGSGSYGYGDSSVGAGAPAFRDDSGSYVARSFGYGANYGNSYVDEPAASKNVASYNVGETDAGSFGHGGTYGNSYVDEPATSNTDASYNGGNTDAAGTTGPSSFGNYDDIVAGGWE
ncbi:DEAD-box ATP-dependent RNA helicase 52C-like [Argentina anserina]|uniref:DEAD-box ATP-dependent RNA helicase 52C-like n=1 Tax=Argentina anserina TaxID=57926 RepID=UPI0021762F39|nr:DEAD-box ATP-dependent RNA helicase 52C-like [Potentilla anserina]XP_050364876.1 DEAD-box ATP-dependent RNA helicase 52C-like [Potentilla anserina]